MVQNTPPSSCAHGGCFVPQLWTRNCKEQQRKENPSLSSDGTFESWVDVADGRSIAAASGRSLAPSHGWQFLAMKVSRVVAPPPSLQPSGPCSAEKALRRDFPPLAFAAHAVGPVLNLRRLGLLRPSSSHTFTSVVVPAGGVWALRFCLGNRPSPRVRRGRSSSLQERSPETCTVFHSNRVGAKRLECVADRHRTQLMVYFAHASGVHGACVQTWKVPQCWLLAEVGAHCPPNC